MHFKYIYFLYLIFFVSINVYGVENRYVVATSSGISQGILKNKVITWNDIPYALAPVNELRWKAPMTINQPNTVINNKKDNFCIQEPSSLGGVAGDDYYVGTEDCLYLDIKSPRKNFKKGLLPVMFWIHGGGNTSGLKDIYDFSKFVKKHNIIIVSINYRLGPFGWFSHPAIQDNQTGLDKTSNFGTLDIISALKWTKNNIDKFGGDPDNITIFGESAGGHNVLSLLVSPQASGLFHKAISQSGYTTSISPSDAYKQTISSNTSDHTSSELVKYLLEKMPNTDDDKSNDLRKLLKNAKAKDIFKFYVDKSNQDIPLMTSDGIVIPSIGLKSALEKNDLINNVPIILGSNRDEVKLWLGTIDYFVNIEYSFFGDVFNIPKVVLDSENVDAFEGFNEYRSNAWQIRGVLEPAKSLSRSGNDDIYLYRFDWDDHRNFFVANFKKLFGAAHATEIPLISGDDNLVGKFGFLIYPKGPSKNFTSRNMMNFWKNFAYYGVPGTSSNGVEWESYDYKNGKHNLLIIDNKPNIKMDYSDVTYKNLVYKLNADKRLNEIEKCVVFYQMTTFVGEDLYNKYINDFSSDCNRSKAKVFIDKNTSYIDF